MYPKTFTDVDKKDASSVIVVLYPYLSQFVCIVLLGQFLSHENLGT